MGLGHPWKWISFHPCKWMAGELAFLFWKKGTWAERVGNTEDGGTRPPLEVEQCPPLEVHGIFDGRRVGLLVLAEGDLGRQKRRHRFKGGGVRTSQEARRHWREV